MQRWFYVDDAGKWGIYQANYPSYEHTELDVNGFVFTEEQYETLLLWADAYNFRRHYGVALDADEYGYERMLINQLFVLASQADAQFILSKEQRIHFFKDNLQKLI